MYAQTRPILSLKRPSTRTTQSEAPGPVAAPAPAAANTDAERLAAQIWHQVENGIDAERLLPSVEKRTNEVTKRLDKPLEDNGWRRFVSGLAHTMLNGKARQRRSSEIMLVETVARWTKDVRELAPEREPDLRRIVLAGLSQPEPPAAK